MRTTLDIDNDVLAAVREMAARERKPLGSVVSGLLYAALTEAAELVDAGIGATGFRAFSSRGVQVTNADVELLRDQQGI